MPDGFTEITDIESLDQFLKQSQDGPAIVFKHSNSCGISSRAYSNLTRLGRPLGLVIVQHARAVSDDLEKRTGVTHETPQLLIFREGEVVWTASHLQIQTEAVEAALAKLGNNNGVSETQP